MKRLDSIWVGDCMGYITPTMRGESCGGWKRVGYGFLCGDGSTRAPATFGLVSKQYQYSVV